MGRNVYVYPGQKRYEPAPPTVPAFPNESQRSTDAEENKSPCESPQTTEDNDLCQQWRMAEAAEELARFFPKDTIEVEWGLGVTREIVMVETIDGTVESPVLTVLLIGCVTYELFFERETRQTGFACPVQDLDDKRLLTPIGPERSEIPVENLKVIRGFGNDTFAD